MDDKQKAEMMWKVVEFVKTLTNDPAEQSEALLNGNSFIQNSLATDSLRILIKNMFNPK